MEDFNMGYKLTGLLERGDQRKYGLQPSHFVAVRRKNSEVEPESTRLYHVYSNFTASSLYDIYDYQWLKLQRFYLRIFESQHRFLTYEPLVESSWNQQFLNVQQEVLCILKDLLYFL